MSRPHIYERLNSIDAGSTMRYALGTDRIYGVRCGDKIVVIAKQAYGTKQYPQLNYKQIFTASRATAQAHCNRLNDVFETNKYEVFEFSLSDIA